MTPSPKSSKPVAPKQREESAKLVSNLDSVLFSDGLEDWLSSRQPGAPLEEGAEPPGAALVPTYCDRAAGLVFSIIAATLTDR